MANYKILMQIYNEKLLPLLTMLNSMQQMDNALQLTLHNSFEIVEVPKKTIILQEGKICTNVWYVVKGLLRTYCQIVDKEITTRLMHTNYLALAPGSYFTQTASTETIQTITNCTLAVITYNSMQYLLATYPQFNYHNRLLTEQYYYKLEQRLYMLRKQDAAAKYQFFLKNYSTYAKYIPQKYIASFLNISPETLSRIRAKYKKE